MTYEIGQKILVEATVVLPRIDGDGDILVGFPNDTGVYVPAANSREIPVEPSLIAFKDILVGDTVRATKVKVTRHKTETTVYDNLTVTCVDGAGFDAGPLVFGAFLEFTYELISRPEPEPLKVGDEVSIEQVKTLPVGSVVTKDDSCFDFKDRMVTKTGLYNPQDVNVTVWYVYDGDTFTVRYIAEES